MMSDHHAPMRERGVARPRMDMGDEHGDLEMTPEMRQEMQREHHSKTLWVPFLVILLGG